MSELIKTIGQRVRNYRIKQNLSQEKLAEMSGFHPTYIGQVERGEKNATIESIARIASALGISLATLFEKLDDGDCSDSIPLKCYELICSKSSSEQEQLYNLLLNMINFKEK